MLSHLPGHLGKHHNITEKIFLGLNRSKTDRIVTCGCAGEFLALTGARLNGKELVAAGLATHFVPLEVIFSFFIIIFFPLKPSLRVLLSCS